MAIPSHLPPCMSTPLISSSIVVMNSGPLIAGAEQTLAAAASDDRQAFNQGMKTVVTALTKVNDVMNSMWNKSKPNDYTSFRTFIFGITSQSMFPQGVIYQGVSDQPMSFRGESGANDSMVSPPLTTRPLEGVECS